MAQRVIKQIGATDIVEKGIVLERKIPIFYDLNELEESKNDFSKAEYLAIAQSYNEIEVWENATWEERKYLAPLLGVRYDYNNAPVLTFPKFEPLCSEREANHYEESEIIEEFHRRLGLKGIEDYQIGKIIEGFYKVCRDHYLNTGDIIENLSNLGWHPFFGCRIIDYGLSKEIFNTYMNWGKENEVSCNV